MAIVGPILRAICLVLGLPAALMLLAAPQDAVAMSFALETSKQGRKAVVATGLIEAGDVERLRRALQGADRDPSGNKLLVLDSLGGPIGEAFDMVAVMDEERVVTEVRAGATCASSCAMILFVSGQSRTVQEGGRLGIHTCFDAATRSRSMACNEQIAQNAATRGVPYASIVALLNLTPPGEMRWIGARGAECWNLAGSVATAEAQGRQAGDPAACLALPSPGPPAPAGRDRDRAAPPRN